MIVMIVKINCNVIIGIILVWDTNYTQILELKLCHVYKVFLSCMKF